MHFVARISLLLSLVCVLSEQPGHCINFMFPDDGVNFDVELDGAIIQCAEVAILLLVMCNVLLKIGCSVLVSHSTIHSCLNLGVMGSGNI